MRRIKAIVALSERKSADTGRAWREVEGGGSLGEVVRAGVLDRLAARRVGSTVAFTGVGTALFCMNLGVVDAIASQAGVGLITSNYRQIMAKLRPGVSCREVSAAANSEALILSRRGPNCNVDIALQLCIQSRLNVVVVCIAPD